MLYCVCFEGGVVRIKEYDDDCDCLVMSEGELRELGIQIPDDIW